MNHVTSTKSGNKLFKKGKLPKFPSALVVIFFVLLFVVVLSWIPHKGWVDTTNPLFYLNQDGLYTSNDALLATWINCDDLISKNISEDSTLILKLTNDGATILTKWLMDHGFSETNIGKIVAGALNGIYITNIVLDKDWNQVAINYSGLSFDLYIKEGNEELLFASIVIDKFFAASTLDKANLTFSFKILSGEVNKLAGTKIGNVDLKEPFMFASKNSANNWFNFWNSDYYLGDSEGRYGILNIPFILLAGFFNAANVILFLFCIGAFVEVMLYSGALEAGTSSLVKKLEGKELLLIPTLFTLFCIGGTTFGMQEESLGLIPLIVPFLVLAGFDTMTGLLVIVVGTTSGIAASVLDPFSIGVMASSLSIETVDENAITIGTGIVIRIVMFIVFLITGAIFCTWYANRARKGKDFVAEPEMFEKNKAWAHQMLGESHAGHSCLNKRQAIGLGIFGFTFVIMVFSILPWTTWFEGLKTNQGWAIFSSFFFAGRLFGEWYFVQLAFLFLISAIILGYVFGLKQRETNLAMFNGMKGTVKVSMILIFSRSIALVLTYSGLTTAMIAMMFSGAGGNGFSLFGLAWILFPVFSFLAIFIPSTSGLAAITGPLIAPIIWKLASTADDQVAMFGIYATIVMVTYPLAQGTINMFMPTTGIVVAEAEVAKVGFGKAFPILMGTAFATMLLGMLIISVSIPIMLM